MRVDLNSDLGESFGFYIIGSDELVMPHVSSANIACGFHAGDPSVIRRSVQLALDHGVAIGAHPGFPDLVGFGRRVLHAMPREVEDFVLYQVAALAGVVAAEGGRLHHVKPHGALYNIACSDRIMADAISKAVAAIDSRLVLFGLSGSCLIKSGKAAGLKVAEEAFADRGYDADGFLLSRSEPGAVVGDPIRVVERAVRMVREGVVLSHTGEPVALRADTICVHGDTPGADLLVAALRVGLEAAGIRVLPVTADDEFRHE